VAVSRFFSVNSNCLRSSFSELRLNRRRLKGVQDFGDPLHLASGSGDGISELGDLHFSGDRAYFGLYRTTLGSFLAARIPAM
jgi:hypothetical protein